MSASRERKNRQDPAASSVPDFKTRRAEEEWKKEHRTNILYASVGIAFVVVAIALLVWNSNFFQRRATAVTIDGEKYTAADVSYYYTTAYNSIVNQYSSYLSYIGLDTKTDLSKQSLNDTAKMFLGVSDDMTWDAFFKQTAKNNMTTVTMLLKEAKANDFAFTDEMQQTMDSTLDSLNTTAKENGYSTSAYLKAVYGTYMNMSTFKSQLKDAIWASFYEKSYTAGLTYSDDDINNYYQENKDSFDVVDYDYVNITATAATTDGDGNTITPTDEDTEKAKQAAKDTADAIMTRYRAGESLSSIAADYSNATAGTRTGATKATATTTTWAFDAARQSGDSEILSDDSYYYVVVFHNRYRNEYDTVNMRHILFKVDTSSLDSTSDTYNDDLAKLRQEALDKANDVMQQWKDKGATEDAFAELADDNSDDNAEGGLYQQVYKNQMATELNDWLFDADRQPGDSDIVLTEDYGYHMIYYIGTDEPYWKVQVKNTLTSNDYSAWSTALVENVTATDGGGMKYVGK
ncbi:MAG: hypothetical protein GXW99_12545 [Clostridiales bacterium]|nr:hypothetical protein [Clostridiales bacterium]